MRLWVMVTLVTVSAGCAFQQSRGVGATMLSDGSTSMTNLDYVAGPCVDLEFPCRSDYGESCLSEQSPGGVLRAKITRSTLGAVDGQYFGVQVTQGGQIVFQERGRRSVGWSCEGHRYWCNTVLFSIPEPLSGVIDVTLDDLLQRKEYRFRFRTSSSCADDEWGDEDE